MSIRAIDWALNQTCGNSLTKFVLVKLADNANDQGQCWPSMRYIAAHCECTRQTVIRCIYDLLQLGLIDVEPRFHNGMKQSNMYQLKMPIKSDVKQLGHDVKQRQKKVNKIKTADVNHFDIEPLKIEPKKASEELKKIIQGLASKKKIQ